MSGLAPVPFSRRKAAEPRISEPYVPGRRSRRFWTAEEDALIRARYPEGGAKACVAHLPGRSSPTIYQRAQKLGVKLIEGRGAGTKVKLEPTPELDERIRGGWAGIDPGRKGALVAFADELGITRRQLYKRALELGLELVPHRKEPRWTSAEDELMAKMPLHDPERCAKIFRDRGFHRTPTAIVVRAKRLSLSRRATHEDMSASGAARILGVDIKWITARCIAGDIRAGRRETKRTVQQGGDTWSIAPAELRRFIVEHIEQIDIRKVEKVAFVDLLANAPPAAEEAPGQ